MAVSVRRQVAVIVPTRPRRPRHELLRYFCRGCRRLSPAATSLPASLAWTASRRVRAALRTSSCRAVSASRSAWLVASGAAAQFRARLDGPRSARLRSIAGWQDSVRTRRGVCRVIRGYGLGPAAVLDLLVPVSLRFVWIRFCCAVYFGL